MEFFAETFSATTVCFKTPRDWLFERSEADHELLRSAEEAVTREFTKAAAHAVRNVQLRKESSAVVVAVFAPEVAATN